MKRAKPKENPGNIPGFHIISQAGLF